MKELKTLESAETGHRLHVVVAEDNAADLFWLEMVFKSARLPYEIALASDVSEAREYFASSKKHSCTSPDFALLDLHMPGTSMEELVLSLPTQQQERLFILSGSEIPTVLREELGDKRCLQKPFTHGQLITCLAAVGLQDRIEEVSNDANGSVV